MNNRKVFGILVAGLAIALLAAAAFNAKGQARSLVRAEAYWPERSTVFLADGQAGVVQGISVRNGIVPVGKIVTPSRASVVALSIDPAAQRLWVLDESALHVYDAMTLRLSHRWQAPYGVSLQTLDRDTEGDLLAVDSNGRRFRPDPLSLALTPARMGHPLVMKAQLSRSGAK